MLGRQKRTRRGPNASRPLQSRRNRGRARWTCPSFRQRARCVGTPPTGIHSAYGSMGSEDRGPWAAERPRHHRRWVAASSAAGPLPPSGGGLRAIESIGALLIIQYCRRTDPIPNCPAAKHIQDTKHRCQGEARHQEQVDDHPSRILRQDKRARRLVAVGEGHSGAIQVLFRIYCLSKTRTCVNSLPSALVPLVVVVIVLPPFEIAVRPVAL